MLRLLGVFLLAATWASWVSTSAVTGGPIAVRATVAESEQEVDVEGLPECVDFDEFEHHKQLFAAIQQGEKSFTVSENRFGKNDASADAKEDGYDTVTTYDLHGADRYFVLDDHVKEVKSISDSHFRHCSAGIADVKVGSIVLGSTTADYMQNDVVKSWLDVTNQVSPNTRANSDGLVIARRVTGVRSSGVRSECYDVDTESVVHPFLLFNGVEIRSVVRHLPDGDTMVTPEEDGLKGADAK